MRELKHRSGWAALGIAATLAFSAASAGAQSPEPPTGATAVAQATATPPAGSSTPAVAPMHVGFTVRAELSQGVRQPIPSGARLVLRNGDGGICSSAPIDPAAINTGGSFTGQGFDVVASKDCSPGDVLTVEIAFPAESAIGSIVLYPITYEPGTTKTLDIAIPPPTRVPDTGEHIVLPATGTGEGRANLGDALEPAGIAVMGLGVAMFVGCVVARQRRARTPSSASTP
jgi:hypothetical protein